MTVWALDFPGGDFEAASDAFRNLGDVRSLAVDMGDSDAIEDFARTCLADTGASHLLMNNAVTRDGHTDGGLAQVL